MTDIRGRYQAPPAPPVELSPRPSTLGEVWDASRTLQATDNSDIADRRLESAWGPTIDAINDVRRKEGQPLLINPVHGIRAFDPRTIDPATTSVYGLASDANVGQAAATADAVAEIARIQKQYPGSLPGVPDTAEKILAPILEKEKAARAHAEQVIGNSSGIAAGAVSFAGGVSKTLEDPAVIAMSLAGGGEGTLARIAAREFIWNTLGTAIMQPQVARNRAAIGEDLTFGEGVVNSLEAGVGGAVIGGGLHLASPIFGKAGAIASHGYDGVMQSVYDALPEPLRKRWAKASDIPESALPEIAETLIGKDKFTPDMLAAIAVVKRGSEITETSPFAPGWRNDVAHEDRLTATMAKILADAPPAPRAGTALSTGVVAAPLDSVSQSVSRGTAAPEISAYMRAVRGAESGGSDTAAAGTSSAYGRYQMTKGTWLGLYKSRFGSQGLSDAQILARRSDGALQDRLMVDLTSANARALERAGHPASADNLYLLHFAGPDGLKVLDAGEHVPVRDLLKRESVEANPFLKDMTAGELRAWAARKVGREVAAPVRAPEGDDGAATRDAALRDEAARLDEQFATRPPGDAEAGGDAPLLVEHPDTDPVFHAPDADPAEVAQFVPKLEIDPESPAPLTEAVIRAGGLDVDRGFSGQTSDAAAFNERKSLISQIVGLATEDKKIGTATMKAFAGAPERALPYGLIDPRRGASVDALAERAAEAGIISGATPEARRAAFISKLSDELGGPPHAGKAARLGEVAAAVDRRAFKRWNADDPIWEEINRAEAQEALDASRQSETAPIAAELEDKGFSDPAGPEAQAQAESLYHDMKLFADANPDATFRVSGDGEERSLKDILAELDDDKAALEALRGCL